MSALSAPPATSTPANRWRADLIRHYQPFFVGILCASVITGAGGLGFFQARQTDEARPSTAANAVDATSAASRAMARSDTVRSAVATVSRPRSGSPWPLWEFQLREPIAPREDALTPPPWRLIGATGTAGSWQLIVLRQGKSDPEYFRVGDKLPGNYRIEAISEEDVTLRHGRRELVLSFIASR